MTFDPTRNPVERTVTSRPKSHHMQAAEQVILDAMKLTNDGLVSFDQALRVLEIAAHRVNGAM